MTIEYAPLDFTCNFSCAYCYQESLRARTGEVVSNWDRVKEVLLKENYRFSLFGGDPLTLSLGELDKVLSFGYNAFKSRKGCNATVNGLQTNGSLITEAHINLFKRWDVHVGVSIDGPDELNAPRASIATTRKIQTNLFLLRDAGLHFSVIPTLHRANASVSRLPQFLDWIRNSLVDKLRLKSLNIHLLEVDTPAAQELALSEDEDKAAWDALFDLHKQGVIEIECIRDIRRILYGDTEHSCCIWNACDPLDTAAVKHISASGDTGNCGRTNKDGINWLKASKGNKERQQILAQIPQEHGGCKDCEFFFVCKGNCPGSAIDGDWRNRSAHCNTWKYIISLVNDSYTKLSLPVLQQRCALFTHPVINRDHSHLDTPHIDYHLDSNLESKPATEATWKL